MNRWVLSVLEYYRFVSARRTVRKHGITPEWRLLLAVTLSITFAVSFMYVVADPMFATWFENGNVNKNGLFAQTTDIGKSNWILISTGSIILFMSWYKDDRLSAPHMVQWHHIFLKFYFAFTAIALSGLLAIAIKNLIGRARPMLYDGSTLWNSVPFEGVYKYASFPSGHSTTAGALAAVLLLVAPRWGLVFAPVAVWIAISRIAVGAHFPSDVVAGLALGVMFTWIYARMFARKRLLFEFGSYGQLMIRNSGAKRARRKARRHNDGLRGFAFRRTRVGSTERV